jgi:hypothetical protein
MRENNLGVSGSQSPCLTGANICLWSRWLLPGIFENKNLCIYIITTEGCGNYCHWLGWCDTHVVVGTLLYTLSCRKTQTLGWMFECYFRALIKKHSLSTFRRGLAKVMVESYLSNNPTLKRVSACQLASVTWGFFTLIMIQVNCICEDNIALASSKLAWVWILAWQIQIRTGCLLLTEGVSK